MSDYAIVPASIAHVKPMSATMRAAGAITVESYGYRPREALRRAFVASMHCRTAVMDGRPVAMWGITGMLLGDVAYVWLVLSEEIRRLPLAIVREARAELQRVAARFSEVSAAVLPDDKDAMRFARFLGFHVDERVSIGDQFVVRMSYRPEAP